MKILSIEVISNAAGIIIIEGNKNNYTVTNLKKPIQLPKDDISIKSIINFQANFSEFLNIQNIDSLVLCEGGKDAKKTRTRMEFIILSECESKNIPYNTYPTGSCTRIINSGYKKETNREFSEDLSNYKLPKYMGKILAAGWKFLE